MVTDLVAVVGLLHHQSVYSYFTLLDKLYGFTARGDTTVSEVLI
jgi:hypothetical protein